VSLGTLKLIRSPVFVGQQLSLVNAFDSLHTLQLDYEVVFYQQVHAIATVQLYAFVLNWLRMLQLKPNAI
jgi:hypothetical protein